MNIHEYHFLLSEQVALTNLLSQASESDVIGRMSLETRLREVENQLDAYEGFSPRLVDAKLTFRGNPVVGSRGIHADFGSDAVKAFADAVGLVGASRHGILASTGRIPHRDNYRLMITGTALGSFGFQVEDAAQQPALEGEFTPVEMAITHVKEILEASIGTDEELADSIVETDSRALEGVRQFLKTVADSEAVCALEFGGGVFRFHDVAQVRRSENRLSQENIQEDDVTLIGQFEGFLPNRRHAEFLVSESDAEFMSDAIGTVISGRVDPAVDEFFLINDFLNQNVKINVHTRRVGTGRPRYLIEMCERLAD